MTLKNLYQEKNAHLRQTLDEVTPYDFYREIFPIGTFERRGYYEDAKGNGIAVKISQPKGIALEIEGDGRARRYTITDDLDILQVLSDADFAILSPISYFGKRRCGKNARYLYALVFDLDGVEMPQLRDTLYQMNKGILPKATFVVNSGTGLHLYYVLTEPVPMYPQNQKYVKELKYALIRQIWNRYTSTIKEPQMQGIMQGFRVVGSGSKLGRDFPVVAFRFGGRVDMDSLLQFIPDSNGERQQIQKIMKKKMSLDEVKEKYPDWYERRIARGEPRGRWYVKRDLYDWWLSRISSEIRVGHRFYGIMTLAIYAKKCGISEDELRKDAFSLLQVYDEMSEEEINRFTKDDIICALEMYNEDYITFPRDDIAKLSGLQIEKNKRNFLKQKEHLQIARAVRDVKVKLNGKDDWRDGNGRPNKRDVVKGFLKEHPEVTKKTEIARTLKINRDTVAKYYDEVKKEIEAELRSTEIQKKIHFEDGHIVTQINPSTMVSDVIIETLKESGEL